jgi:hypothetical protein
MKPRILAGVARIAVVGAVAAAALGSASSQRQSPPPQVAPYGGQGTQPPPPVAMEPAFALGLWKSSWGAVKIEEDAQLGAGNLHGVFVYQQNGQDVVGYFAGRLNGNVLQFTWQEPAQTGPLEGAGYVVFDPAGQRFAGRWWTTARDRAGEWNGWRQPPPGQGPFAPPPGEAPPAAPPAEDVPFAPVPGEPAPT